MKEHPALLRLVRAVAVLDGLDVTSGADGVRVGSGIDGATVGWPEIHAALGDDDPLDPAPRLRLRLLLALRRRIADLGEEAAPALTRAARPLALPASHPLHPGPGWVRETVPGAVLDLGVGVGGLLAHAEGVVPVPPSVADTAGLATRSAWRRLIQLGECAGEVAADRWARRTGRGGPLDGVFDGAGGCDALSLVALPGVRGRLAAVRTAGAEPAVQFWPHALVSAPSRRRVWTGRRAADSGYARAVWMLTSRAERGVAAPLLLDTGRIAPAPPAQRSGNSPTRA